jgi:glucose-1-phosphatase
VNIDFDAFPNTLGLLTPASRHPFEEKIIPLIVQHEIGRISIDAFLDGLHTAFDGRFERDLLQRAWDAIICEQNEAIVPLFEEVNMHYRTAVLSNTSETHWVKALAIAPLLARIPVQYHFTSFQIGTAKPGLHLYEHAIRTLQSTPKEIVFIDDLEENIRGAEACGIRGIVFRSPEQARRELESMGIL